VVALPIASSMGYWSVDVPLLWDIIANELPALKVEVLRLLRDSALD
jgi:uncharacterized protein with HEPN domain